MTSLLALVCALKAVGPSQPLTVAPELAELQVRREMDTAPTQALRYIGREEEDARLVDPSDFLHPFPATAQVESVVITPKHIVGLSKYPAELRVGPRRPGAALASVLTLTGASEVDAIAGAGDDGWVAVVDNRNLIKVAHLDAGGRAGPFANVGGRLGRAVRALRLARTGAGDLAVAWVQLAGRDQPSTLWVAWLDKKGAPRGAPIQVDEAAGLQLLTSIALTATATGADVAWVPVVPDEKPRGREQVAVELRAFRVTPGAPPRNLRKVALTTLSWVVAGSAGGVMPNELQSVALGGQTLFLWTDYAAKDQALLRAVMAEGGDPVTVVDQSALGSFVARRLADGGAVASIVFLGFSGRDARLLQLRCDAGPPAARTDAPLTTPLPASGPSDGKLTRPDCERLLAHVTKLRGDEPLKPDERERKLVDCVKTGTRGTYDCVMSAQSAHQTQRCR